MQTIPPQRPCYTNTLHRFGIELDPERAQNAIEHVKAELGIHAERVAIADHEGFDAVTRLWSLLDGYRAVMARARADLAARLDELVAAEQAGTTMDYEFEEQLNLMGYRPADDADDLYDEQEEHATSELLERMRQRRIPAYGAADPPPHDQSPPHAAPDKPTGSS